MSNQKDLQEYIDAYRAGEITETNFKNRLASDVALQQEYEQHKKDLLVIRDAAKAQLRKKAALALHKHEQKPAKVFSLKRVLSLAAAIAILIVAFFVAENMNQPSSASDLFAAHFELPSPMGERNASAQSEVWNEAMLAYTNRDFDKTITMLSPLLDKDDFLFPNRGKLYIGLCRLMKQENDQAFELFDDISSESSYVQDAEWYRALTLLKMNNLEEAKNAFQKIAQQKRHFKQQEAEKILENL
jgi:hypothetical protein